MVEFAVVLERLTNKLTRKLILCNLIGRHRNRFLSKHGAHQDLCWPSSGKRKTQDLRRKSSSLRRPHLVAVFGLGNKQFSIQMASVLVDAAKSSQFSTKSRMFCSLSLKRVLPGLDKKRHKFAIWYYRCIGSCIIGRG